MDHTDTSAGSRSICARVNIYEYTQAHLFMHVEDMKRSYEDLYYATGIDMVIYYIQPVHFFILIL